MKTLRCKSAIGLFLGCVKNRHSSFLSSNLRFLSVLSNQFEFNNLSIRTTELYKFPWFTASRQKVPVISCLPDVLLDSTVLSDSTFCEIDSNAFINYAELNMESLYYNFCKKLQAHQQHIETITDKTFFESNKNELSFEKILIPLLRERFELFDYGNYSMALRSYCGAQPRFINTVHTDEHFNAVAALTLSYSMNSQLMRLLQSMYEDSVYLEILGDILENTSLTPMQQFMVNNELELCKLCRCFDRHTTGLTHKMADRITFFKKKLLLMQWYFDMRMELVSNNEKQTVTHMDDVKHMSHRMLDLRYDNENNQWVFNMHPEVVLEFLRSCTVRYSREWMWCQSVSLTGQRLYEHRRLSNHYLTLNQRTNYETFARFLGYSSPLVYQLTQTGLTDCGLTDRSSVDQLIQSLKTTHQSNYLSLLDQAEDLGQQYGDITDKLQPWDIEYWCSRLQESHGLPLKISANQLRHNMFSLIHKLFGINIQPASEQLQSQVKQMTSNCSSHQVYMATDDENGSLLGHIVWLADGRLTPHVTTGLGCHSRRFVDPSVKPTVYCHDPEAFYNIYFHRDSLTRHFNYYAGILQSLAGAPCLLPRMFHEMSPEHDLQPGPKFLHHFFMTLLLSPAVLAYLFQDAQPPQSLVQQFYSKFMMEELHLAAYDTAMWSNYDDGFRQVQDQLWKQFVPVDKHVHDEWPCSCSRIFGGVRACTPVIADPLAALIALDALQAFRKAGLDDTIDSCGSVGSHFRQTFLSPDNANSFLETFRLFRGRDILLTCPDSYLP